jgi:hypothetical protein
VSKTVVLCRILSGVIVAAVLSPTVAHATPYQYEIGCFNEVERCWATNFAPNSGYLGNQSRIDDLIVLPTLNGSTNLWYGSPSLNANTCTGLPSTGGDYPWGGGDACGTSECKYPAGVSCNYSPSQFATQTYVDERGQWHFAMGGASQCESDGHEVPCNLGHRFYPYDCNGAYSSNCVYTSPQDMPFTWGSPSNMYFEMYTNLYVGGASGPFHAFLCADIADPTTGGWLEICDEPYNSTGNYEWTHISCTSNKNFAMLWQPAGANSSYMTAGGSDTNKAGVAMGVGFTMTRGQFLNLIRAAHSECGIPGDESMDNWKLYYSENGMEEIGAAGYGAGINWQVWNEIMVTNY